MLTADLVRATRRGTQLHVQPLTGKNKQRAEELASAYLELALAQCGGTQQELESAWAEVEVAPREIKLAAGLRKLIEDACEFDSESAVEPPALRAQMAWPEVFKDPMRWYQSVCQQSMEGARKAFDAINGTSEALSESVSRLQSSAQQAGTKIEQALTTAASRMRDAA